jgi:coronin-7
MTQTLHLYDLREPASPTLTIQFNTSSSPSTCLFPLIDSIRKIAYLTGRHTSSIYALDLNANQPLPTILTLPNTILDAAILPPYQTDVMRAEINRLYVLTKSEIIPVSVRIERKSYLDFHEDLFPDVFGPVGVAGDKWGVETREKVSLDPERQEWRKKINQKEDIAFEDSGNRAQVTSNQNAPERERRETGSGISDPPTTVADTTISPLSQPAAPVTAKDPPLTSNDPPTSLASNPPQPADTPKGTRASTSPSVPPTPRAPGTYTRSFLTGSHHHPSTSYTSLPPLPTLQSHRLLHATAKHIFFPIAGPGGRLVVLPLDKPGRFSEHEHETIEMGCGIVDFEGCHFDERVVLAGEDGSVRVFDRGNEKRIQVEKVVQVSWHPLASDVIGVLCIEQGSSEFRIWNCESGEGKSCRLEYPVSSLWTD